MIFKVFKKYGFIGSIRLIRDIIFTKLIFPRQRIVRWPFYIRGKSIQWGSDLTTGVGLRIDIIGQPESGILIFGNNIQLNDYVHIGVAKSVTIEDNVLIGSKVLITDHDHGIYRGNSQSDPYQPQIEKKINSRPVHIESNVWIGEGVCILSGVRIGKNSIIGSGSQVIRDVPENSIAVGSPARVVKQWSFELKEWKSL